MQIFRADVVLPVDQPAIRDGGVAVADGRIVAVGPAERLPDGESVTFDGVLTPGLVNAHTHLCFSAYADHYGNGKEFFEWIQDFARRNPTMSETDWRDSVNAGVAASLRAGVTAVADVVTGPAALAAVLDCGLPGTAYYEACFVDEPRWTELAGDFAALVDASAARHHDGPMRLGVSPHTLYTLGKSVGVQLAELARERGLRLHPHLAETRHEDSYVRTGTGSFADVNRKLQAAFELLDGGSGTSPTLEMDAWGLLGADSHVAHGVHVDAADRALLRERCTAVALCPRSNARLLAGQPPVAAYRAEGNPVAVGTDSLASSPDLDVAAELPVLRPGARADLAVFDVDVAGDPYRALVSQAAGSCVATVLSGQLIRHD